MPRKAKVRIRATGARLRVIGYPRVSTEEQARDGASIETQIAKIEMFCKLHELELVAMRTDAGYSGKSLDRPGIKWALNDLQQGRADGLVITKLDRLTRSLEDWSTLIKRYFRDESGPKLFSVSDSIDTRTANGRMVLNLIMSIAEWEREIIGERTKEALQGKISRGERCGKVRYGYKLDPTGPMNAHGRPVRLIEEPGEQFVIGRMKAWRKSGLTYQRVAEMLNQMGFETKDGRPEWDPKTVHRILNRPIA